MVCLCGCDVTQGAENYRDAAAVDLAIATMTDVPKPEPTPEKCSRCNGTGWITHGDGHQTRCPDCQTGDIGGYGSPLDTYRDAKALIAKGNELADRGKAFLDAAEADGKIMLAVNLPKLSKSTIVTGKKPGPTCAGGVCDYTPGETPKPNDKVSVPPPTKSRVKKLFRVRLWGRFRR